MFERLRAWLRGTNAPPHLYGSLVGGKGRITVNTNVPVGTTAVQLLPLNNDRRVALISNNSASAIFLGKDATVTVATGMNLAAASSLTDVENGGAWFAIAGSAGLDCRILEIS